MSNGTLSDALSSKSSRQNRDVEKAKEAVTGRQDEPTRRLNANVPESLYEEFKDACGSEGRSMTWVLTQMLEDYVSKSE